MRHLFVYTMSQVQICACTRICIWRMYDGELLSELPYNQAGVSMPDYRAALVVKALEIEYNIFNV